MSKRGLKSSKSTAKASKRKFASVKLAPKARGKAPSRKLASRAKSATKKAAPKKAAPKKAAPKKAAPKKAATKTSLARKPQAKKAVSKKQAAKKPLTRKVSIRVCPICGFKPFVTGEKHPFAGKRGRTLSLTRWCDGKRVIEPKFVEKKAPAKKKSAPKKRVSEKEQLKRLAEQEEKKLLARLAQIREKEKELERLESEQRKKEKTLRERSKEPIKVTKEKPSKVKIEKRKGKKEEKPLVVSPLEHIQNEALRKAGIPERPTLCPTLDEIANERYKKSLIETKQLVGRGSKKRSEEKLEELERKWISEGLSKAEIRKRLADKEETQRVSKTNYAKKVIDIRKMNVDFDPENPVMIYPEAAEATAVTLKEYFRPFAEEFVDAMRGKTEESYILRVKTLNWIQGMPKPREEGIGTERTQLSTFIPKEQLADLRRRHPGMSDEQLLRDRQLRQLEAMLKDLFEYFLNRFDQYMSRKMLTSLAVTGFSMEVVEKVVEENVDRRGR